MPISDSLWFDEQSVNDPRQIESDQNTRLFHHFISLETNEEKIDFILGGTFEKNAELWIQNSNGHLERKDANLFSPQEKNDFKLAVDSFFYPSTYDGEPDFDEFERRMDALAERIAKFHEEQCKFMEAADVSAITDNPNYTEFNKEYVTKTACPASIQRYALMDYLEGNQHSVDVALKHDYLQRKGAVGISGDGLIDTLNGVAKSMVKDYNPASEKLFNRTCFMTLSREAEKKIKLEATEATNTIATKYKDIRVWMHPEKSITIESLGKLDNLNGQLKDADHWYHRDSKEFKQFKAALNEVHEKYEQYKNLGRELTDAEKQSMIPLFDKVANAADSYLDGKETRARKTDLGRDRYDIAFSALHITSRGLAGGIIKHHNSFNEKRGSKKISVKELEERAGRTAKQQKEYQKAQKEAAKQKSSTAKSDPPSMTR